MKKKQHPSITIVIADAHKLIREGWSELLNQDARFHVVAAGANARTTLELTAALKPDIVLLDINLPGILETTIPGLHHFSCATQVICIAPHKNATYARRMMQQGAAGYITKDSTTEELCDAIITVHNGKKFICRNIKESIAHKFTTDQDDRPKIEKLTPRERGIIESIRNGLSSKQIAEQLSLSVKTVEVHRYNILRKLELKNTAALINYFNKH
jgi:DNA-binding NarL/FixJ family response regulator